MADGKIIIDTKIDSSGAEKGIGNLGNIAKRGLNIVAGALVGVTATLGGMSAYALKVGADFEEGMSKVQAISGATASELESLTEKAKEMGAKTKFSASESAAAFVYMAQAGWKTSDMLNGIEGVMNLAASSGEDLASVSAIVTDSLTAFGLQAKDSAHFADVLARASSDSNTNVGLMGYTFQYVAPVAGALGYSIEDCAVAIGLMANAGIKGEKSGTALRAIFTNLVSPTDTVAGAMKKLNIEVTNADGTMKPLNKLLQEMRCSFAGLSDEEKASTAAALAGKEAMSGLLAIVNASDSDFNKLTESINNANGSAGEMATIMQDNLKGKVEQLGGALETLGITAYEKFQGPMKEAVESVTGTIEKLGDSMNDGELEASITKLAKSFGELITKVASFLADNLPGIIDGLAWILDNSDIIAAGIAGIGVAMMTMNVANMIMGLVESFKAFKLANEGATVAQWLLNAAMTANPIGLVIALIAGIVAAIVALWVCNDDFRNAVTSAWESIKEVASAVFGWICDFFTETIPEAFNSVKTFFTEDVPTWFSEMWDSVSQFFVEGWNSIVSFFTESIPAWLEEVQAWFGRLPEMVGYCLGYCLAAVVKFGADCWNWVTVELPLIIEGIVTWFSELPARIGEWLTQCLNDITTWGAGIYEKASQAISDTIDSIVTYFSELPGRISEWLSSTLNNIATWGVNMYESACQAASDTVDGVIEWFNELPGKMVAIGKNIVEGIWEGITGAGGWLLGKIGEFAGGIVDGIKDFFGIHSPSRLMRDLVGTNIVKGIGVGIDLETPNLEKDINANMSDLTAKLKTTVDYETAKTTANVVAQNSFNIVRGDSEETGRVDRKTENKTTINKYYVGAKEFMEVLAPYADDVLDQWRDGR